MTIGFLQTPQTHFKNRADCKIGLKKRYSMCKVTYITVKNTSEKRQQYVVNLITEVKHQKNEGRQNKKYHAMYVSFEDEAKNLK